MAFSYVCSLGSNCHTAYYLKLHKLKLASYPFDWVDIRNEKNVLHCLKDDFNTFLDKSYYEAFEKGKRRHSFYSYKFFNHKDPMKDEDYNYYIRCIERFRNLLVLDENKLFVLGFYNLETITDERMKEIVEFNREFSNYAKNYTLLVILHKTGTELKHTIKKIENICFLEVETRTPSNGIVFKERGDNDYLEAAINSIFQFKLKTIMKK
jgi:hypothetical protein